MNDRNINNPHYINNILRYYAQKQLNFKYNGDCWINFQEKYEYNPIHNHTGVFSYVIWYQIPYYKEDEHRYGAGIKKDIRANNNGEFQFVHTFNNIIYETPLPIDKKMEGYMAIFPSSLNHIVYPFYTSDDYRITLSGNILLH